MTYKVSQEAAKELEKIWRYTLETWSADQANRYLSLLFHEIDYLCVKPESGIAYSHIRKGYFKSKVKSHLIFYKVNPKKKELEIIRILHEMMDVDSHLSP